MKNPADEPWLNVLWQYGSYAGGSRVSAAWQHATGRGVHIGVIDDGIDARHAELIGQLDAGRSFDFAQGVAGFGSGVGSHGTAVAGVIGAAADGVGLVGVAPDASIAMLKVAFGSSGLATFEQALVRADRFDVINCSWGFNENWVDPAAIPTIAAMQADIAEAARDGRGGLGTAVLFAAGNGRADGSWTAAQALQGQAEVITVASVDWRGQVTTSAPGPSILVAAGGEQVWSLDATGDQGFVAGDYARVSGTSFAVALVSGVVALMLEANPGLGLRDIQDILAVSASQTDTAAVRNAATLLNGGGLGFSNDTGFGVVQADLAVRLAETWLVGTTARDFHNADHLLATGVAAAGGLAFTLGAGTVQKATLAITLPDAAWGHVSLDLVSPGGTVSRLLDARTTADGPASDSWEFVSNAFWGEAAAGQWRLRVTPQDGVVVGKLQASLDVLGDTDGPARLVLTDGFVPHDLQLDRPTILDAAAATRGLTLDLAGSDQSWGGVAFRLKGAPWVDTAIGGAGADWLGGTEAGDHLYGGDGDDQLFGRGGDDELSGGAGVNRLDGGDGWDVARFDVNFSDCQFGLDGGSLVVRGADFTDRLTNIEALSFADGTQMTLADLRARVDLTEVFRVSQGGRENWDLAARYDGPVNYLQWVLRSTAGNQTVFGTAENDFIKLDGGGNAVDPGAGRDVIDAGPGSNFMLSGTGTTVFYLDGRGGQVAWNTIVSWSAGDQAAIWGWQPGVSKMSWRASDGAVGAMGATMHADLNGDGNIDISLTWAGLDLGHLPQSQAMSGLLWFL